MSIEIINQVEVGTKSTYYTATATKQLMTYVLLTEFHKSKLRARPEPIANHNVVC